MKHYTNEELDAMIEAAIDEGDLESAEVLQGILDTREADEYARTEEAETQ